MATDELRQRAIALYDHFTHVSLDRRALIADLTKLAGSLAAAEMLLAGIAADPAAAQLTSPQDPDLSVKRVQWPVAGGRTMKGYWATPRRMVDPLPAVVVIHENRGLNAHIEDVARRVAKAGFLAVAPDFLTSAGGTPVDQDAARAAIGLLDAGATVADGLATIDWLRRNPRCTGRVGIVGFCWGGGVVDRLAVAGGARLAAAVSFYGPAPAPSEAARVSAPIMLHLAGTDDRVNASALPFAEALRSAGKSTHLFSYPGVQHAFHNDTSVDRYDAAAAKLAWDRTIAFFNTHLRPV